MSKAEREYMSKVARLGCVVCWRLYGPHDPGPVELHHPRTGAGMGRRASNEDVLPICYEHHRGDTGLHGMGRKAFESHYGFTEMELLDDVRKRVGADKR